MTICEHNLVRLGFEIIDKQGNEIKAIAALFCSRCGLFRTKVLIFRLDRVES